MVTALDQSQVRVQGKVLVQALAQGPGQALGQDQALPAVLAPVSSYFRKCVKPF